MKKNTSLFIKFSVQTSITKVEAIMLMDRIETASLLTKIWGQPAEIIVKIEIFKLVR